jgi:hypothetical protein
MSNGSGKDPSTSINMYAGSRGARNATTSSVSDAECRTGRVADVQPELAASRSRASLKVTVQRSFLSMCLPAGIATTLSLPSMKPTMIENWWSLSTDNTGLYWPGGCSLTSPDRPRACVVTGAACNHPRINAPSRSISTSAGHASPTSTTLIVSKSRRLSTQLMRVIMKMSLYHWRPDAKRNQEKLCETQICRILRSFWMPLGEVASLHDRELGLSRDGREWVGA